MKCQKCGADIPEGKIYCGKCGQAIQMVPDYVPEEDIAISPEISGEKQRDGSTEVPHRPFKRYILLSFMVCLLGVAVSRAAYESFFQTDDPEAHTEPLIVLLEKPQFSIEPGIYSYTPKLTLSHPERDDGLIYYTIDGSTPDESSRLYNAPIELTEGINIIRAVFIRSDGMMSEEASGTYEIVFNNPDEPVIGAPGGDYQGEFFVKITSPDDVPVYYTTNGEEPGQKSKLYKGPIRISPGLTVLQAIAIDQEGNSSAIVEAIYRVSEAVPTEEVVPEEIPAP